MLREAQIILPLGAEPSLTPGQELAAKLLAQWGGYSQDCCDGYWRDPKDGKVYADYSSARYTIAMEPTIENAILLAGMAVDAGRAARQQAIYVRQANGEVEILECLAKESEEISIC